MIKRILITGVLLIMVFSLGACVNNIPYNAVLYSNANGWMNEDFLKENLTRGCRYVDESGEAVNASGDEYPVFVTKVITTVESFDEKFSEFPPKVDFEKEIILVYIFTDIYPARNYNLQKIMLNGTIIDLEYKIEKPKGKDAAMPAQRCFVVKLDRIDVSAASFIEVK